MPCRMRCAGKPRRFNSLLNFQIKYCHDQVKLTELYKSMEIQYSNYVISQLGKWTERIPPPYVYARRAAMPVINSWISLTSLDFGAKDSHKGAAAEKSIYGNYFFGGLIVTFLRALFTACLHFLWDFTWYSLFNYTT